jgi:hypothetical protein
MPEDEESISIPSLSSGGAGSRFVTEKEVVSAREKRDEEWNAAYERSLVQAGLLSCSRLYRTGLAKNLHRSQRKKCLMVAA